MKRLSLLLCVGVPFCASSLQAQFETASVLGNVRDASGAIIPGASVALINDATRTEVDLTTNAQGGYEFTSVKVGQYHITAKAPGFNISNTTPFSVQVNARQRVDVALQAGASETVTVTGAASLLQTDDSERGQVIGTREVENLPLNGRAYADLAALVPGVRRNLLENGSDSSRDASFNVNGQRSEFNNFLLDGLDNNAYGTSNQGFSNQAIPPSPDAINEFKVETDNYSAEYGRAAGAVINVSIRSGTNQLHGKVYDYIRNTAFNAIGPFAPPLNPATGVRVKPVLIRNQFGGTLGGPIWKDHTFFFADYEGTRQVTRAIMTATVPNADQNGTSALAIRNGGYTFLNAAGGAIRLINPLTGAAYMNGIVPFSDPTVSSFAKGVLGALPAANVSSAPYQNNYVSQPRDPISDNKGDIRIDHTFTQHTNMFFRFSEHRADIQSPPNIQGQAGGNANGNVLVFNQQFAGGVTHVFSQNSIVDARFAYGHTDGAKSPYGANLPSLMTGIPGLPTDPVVARSLNAQSVNGFTQFGNQTSNPQFQNPTIYNPKVNYTQIVGRNTLKMGYEYQTIATTIDDFNPTYGQSTYNGGFSFNGIAAANGTVNSSASALSGADIGTREGVALSDFLFGAQSAYQLNNFVIVHLNQRMHFMYLQDDARLGSKFTLNAGLRYELVTPQWESNNLLSNFDPIGQRLLQASPGSIYNRALVNMPTANLAPRLGFAATVTPKTVLRGGYGINYVEFNREGGENLLVYNLPNIVNTNINQIPSGAIAGIRGSNAGLGTCSAAQVGAAYNPAAPSPCFRLTTQGFPTGFTSPSVVTPASYANTQSRYIPANLPTGYVQAWHGTVQQQVGPQTTVEVSYVGEHGTRLQVLADYNQASGNPLTATCNPSATNGCVNQLNGNAGRPLKTFTTIEETLPSGYLSYNALQTKVEHRTGHGLYLLNSFTWSHAIDNASGHLDTNNGDNSRINLLNGGAGERGNSGYNQPLNETLSIVYDLPYGHGRTFGSQANKLMQEALGGWQLTLIENADSGQPINVTYTPNSFQSLSTILNQRPDQVSKNVVIPKAQRTKLAGAQSFNALNTAAFNLPDVNHPYGSAGRNSVRFDPYFDTDLGVHKGFELWREGTSFDFRAEAFNVLNQTNYSFATSNLSSGFGTVTAATTFPARVLQFAGKIIF